jgi:hypothetical protein
MQDDWRSNAMKTRRVRQSIVAPLAPTRPPSTDATLELVKSQNDY